jgi:hypothetical protein
MCNPTISQKCDIDFKDHSWIKKETIRQDLINNNNINKDDKDIQLIMMEKLLEENSNLSSLEIITKFRTANPNLTISIGIHEVNLIKKNLRNRIIEKKTVMERINELKGNNNENICKAKVFIK